MDEELDASEGARIFKALHEARLPPLQPPQESEDLNWRYWEFPVDAQGIDRDERLRLEPVPETELQAVQQAAPHHEPAESAEEIDKTKQGLFEAVNDVWATLTETERWIYHMLVDVGLSMRFVALALGTPKTTFARRRDALALKIKNELLRHQAVIDHLAKGHPDLQRMSDTDPET
jgi:hypothetical protein